MYPLTTTPQSPPGCVPSSHAAVATAPHGLPVVCLDPSPLPHASLGSGLPGPAVGSAASGSGERPQSWRGGARPVLDRLQPSWLNRPLALAGTHFTLQTLQPCSQFCSSQGLSLALPPKGIQFPLKPLLSLGGLGRGEEMEMSAGPSFSTKPWAPPHLDPGVCPQP